MATAKTFRTIEQKLADLDAQRARLLKTSRKLENGQKIIIGSIVLAHAESDPKAAAALSELLQSKATRDIDKKRLAPVIQRLQAVIAGKDFSAGTAESAATAP